MYKILIIAIITIASVLASTQTDTNAEDLEALWNAWKIQYHKSYTPTEEPVKFRIFEDNYNKIKAFNAIHEEMKLGLTKFADLTSEEFKNIYLDGLRIDVEEEMETEIDTDIDADADADADLFEKNPLPRTTWDWRYLGVVGPVKNQKNCGSCWAFSVIGSLESMYAIKHSSPVPSLSEQQLVDCDSSNHGCNGGVIPSAYRYIKNNNGVMKESDMPYIGNRTICRFDSKKAFAKISNYTRVAGNDKDMANTLYFKGPLSVALDATNLQLYKSGIYNCRGQLSINHGAVIVGYAKKFGAYHWIVKNSWGQNWGQRGYFDVAFDTCGINAEVFYPSVV